MITPYRDAIGQEINIGDKMLYYYCGGSRAYGSIKTVWERNKTEHGEFYVRAHKGGCPSKNDGRITNFDNCVVLKRNHFPQFYEDDDDD